MTQLGMVQLWQGDWAACRRTALLMQGTAEQVHGLAQQRSYVSEPGDHTAEGAAGAYTSVITRWPLLAGVDITDDPDKVLLHEMYERYMGGKTPPPEPDAERLIVRIAPEKLYLWPPT